MNDHLQTKMPPAQPGLGSSNRRTHDFEQQCLRVLRCTARALANSPGGLRFKAGTRPWLDAIAECSSSGRLTVQPGGCV